VTTEVVREERLRGAETRGRLVLSVPTRNYLKHLVIATLGRTGGKLDPYWDWGFIKFYTVDSMATLLWEAGFERLECQAGRCRTVEEHGLCGAQAGGRLQKLAPRTDSPARPITSMEAGHGDPRRIGDDGAQRCLQRRVLEYEIRARARSAA
jgi:hypothetical protein